MSSNRTFSRREECKQATVLPVVSDLGPKITMPNKTNRSAARAVASGHRFWDERKARRRTLARQEVTESYPLPHRLRRKRRQWLTAHLSGWSWAGGESALVAPAAVTAEQLHDLVNRTFMDGGLIRDIHGLNVALARVREDNVVPAIIEAVRVEGFRRHD